MKVYLSGPITGTRIGAAYRGREKTSISWLQADEPYDVLLCAVWL